VFHYQLVCGPFSKDRIRIFWYFSRLHAPSGGARLFPKLQTYCSRSVTNFLDSRGKLFLTDPERFGPILYILLVAHVDARPIR
jgi:hypothetical protein